MAPLRFGPMACRFGPPTPTQWELQLGGVLDVGVSPTALLLWCSKGSHDAQLAWRPPPCTSKHEVLARSNWKRHPLECSGAALLLIFLRAGEARLGDARLDDARLGETPVSADSAAAAPSSVAATATSGPSWISLTEPCFPCFPPVDERVRIRVVVVEARRIIRALGTLPRDGGVSPACPPPSA